MNNPNRYRISSKFTIVKIAICIAFLGMALNLASNIYNNTYTQNNAAGFIFGCLFFSGLLYYLKTRKIIEYDDVKHILYVLDSKRQFYTEIPVERIDKISLSGISNLYKSYTINYRDSLDQAQTICLYPVLFRKDIDTLIADAKYKNPDMVVRKWFVG